MGEPKLRDPAALDDDDELQISDEPEPLGDEPDAAGFDLELGDFARDGEPIEEEESPLEFDPLPEFGQSEADGDEDAPLALGADEVSLLELPADAAGDDAPLGDFDDHDDLLGDAGGEDDGGQEGARGIESELEEPEVADDEADDAEGPTTLAAVRLPPWADTLAVSVERAVDDATFVAPSLPPGALAIGRDAHGDKLVVLEHEDGAVFLRGEKVISDRVPELPLAGIALHAGQPVYWVDGEGLLLDQTEVPFTEGTVALCAHPRGLLLGLSTSEGAALAFWPDATPSAVESIAVLPSAPVALAVAGEHILVRLADGARAYLLPESDD